MLESKRYFAPFDTGLFRTSYSHNPQKHSQSAHFSSKNGYLLMFLAGPKFRNLPASKLASDFRPFAPGIFLYYLVNSASPSIAYALIGHESSP